MINTDLLKEYFPEIVVNDDYIFAENNVIKILSFLKLKNYVEFDMITQIIATDYNDFIQLTYRLYSTASNEFLNVVTNVVNEADTAINLYKSAYYDECEIYDLLGVNFIGNDKLKRLYMPESWVGHPLLKSYAQSDERLVWND